MCVFSCLSSKKGSPAPSSTHTNGELESKKVAFDCNLSSKTWGITAIAVGSLIFVGLGGFGGLGLLHSHGLLSLPQWLTPAINAVGQTPHLWSLWTITAGGLVLGGSLITYGSFKMSATTKKEGLLEDTLNKLLVKKFKPVVDSCSFYIESLKDMPPESFTLHTFSDWVGGNDNQNERYLIIKTKDDALFYAQIETAEDADLIPFFRDALHYPHVQL